jgi:hypothetical protein
MVTNQDLIKSLESSLDELTLEINTLIQNKKVLPLELLMRRSNILNELVKEYRKAS